MRLEAFRIHAVARQVEVWEHAPLRVSLDRVVRRRLVSLPASAAAELGVPILPVGFRARDGQEVRVSGFILGDDRGNLIDFLVDRYVPLGDGDLDCALRRLCCEGAPREEIARQVARLVEGAPGVRFPRRLRGRHPVESPVVVDGGAPDFARIENADGLWACAASCGCLVLRHDVEEGVGAARVPRSRFVSLRDDNDDDGVLWWDGAGLERLRRFEDLPVQVREGLDREGTALAAAAGMWAGAGLRPVFVVRVRRELAQAGRGGRGAPGGPPAGGAARPPHPALAHAALLFDSRTTVPLRARGGMEPPVLEDDEAAAWVLGHSAGGGTIYLPGAPPRPWQAKPPAWLPGGGDADTWLVGALPDLGE